MHTILPRNPSPLVTACLLALVAALLLPREATAQAPITKSKDPGQWALIYADTLAKNRKLLSEYSWIYRVEVSENSKPLYIDHLSARYGSDGRVVTERIEKQLQMKERQGPLLKAGQEARLKETEKKIEVLKKHIGDYVYMTRGQVVDFFGKARKTEAVGYDNALRLDAESVVNPGDSVTLFGDKSTAFPIYLAFTVPLDAKTSIRCEVFFRHLRQVNAFYGSRVTGEFVETGKGSGAKALRIDVESYDYLAKP
jgi:hypothetical protein